jgi:hypothetical protein
MKTKRSILLKPMAVFLILASVLLLIVPGAQAKVRTGVEFPAYARIELGFAIHTAEWAAIVFYRPTECVPEGFNLLNFFDPEFRFDCAPQTVEGFAIWSGEPHLTPPIQWHLRGLGAVPVWFVSWPELEAAWADGILTIVELEEMPSLMFGSASFYSETLHPYDPSWTRNSMIEYEAHGVLADGRAFKIHALAVTPYHNAKWLENINISFK